MKQPESSSLNYDLSNTMIVTSITGWRRYIIAASRPPSSVTSKAFMSSCGNRGPAGPGRTRRPGFRWAALPRQHWKLDSKANLNCFSFLTQSRVKTISQPGPGSCDRQLSSVASLLLQVCSVFHRECLPFNSSSHDRVTVTAVPDWRQVRVTASGTLAHWQ